jgi:hypothetical protein
MTINHYSLTFRDIDVGDDVANKFNVRVRFSVVTSEVYYEEREA